MQVEADFSQVGTSATPGVCFHCRSHERNGAPVLYTGMWIDAEMGHIELCREAVAEMAAAYGFIASEKAEGLRKSNRSLGGQLAAELKVSASLSKQIEALQDTIEALKPVKR